MQLYSYNSIYIYIYTYIYIYIHTQLIILTTDRFSRRRYIVMIYRVGRQPQPVPPESRQAEDSCLYIYIYIYVYTYIPTYIHTYIHIYSISYVYIDIYIYTYIRISGPYSSVVRARAQEAEVLGSILTTSN